MSDATDTRQERINLRLKRDSKQMLERAASFEGKTVSSGFGGATPVSAAQVH